MASNKFVRCMVIVAFAIVMTMSHNKQGEAVITCGQVAGALAQCLSYLKGQQLSPPPLCCTGVKSLNSAAKTTADRRTVCECLKKAAPRIPGIQEGPATALAGKCGVSIPYRVSANTNCNNVQ